MSSDSELEEFFDAEDVTPKRFVFVYIFFEIKAMDGCTVFLSTS